MSQTNKASTTNAPSRQAEQAPEAQAARQMLTPLFAALAQRIAADYSASDDGSSPPPWMGALIAGGATLVAASSLIGY